jgi:hypothetical protein
MVGLFRKRNQPQPSDPAFLPLVDQACLIAGEVGELLVLWHRTSPTHPTYPELTDHVPDVMRRFNKVSWAGDRLLGVTRAGMNRLAVLNGEFPRIEGVEWLHWRIGGIRAGAGRSADEDRRVWVDLASIPHADYHLYHRALEARRRMSESSDPETWLRNTKLMWTY